MYGYSVTDDLNYDKTFHVDWYVNQVDNIYKYQEICTIWSDTGETITKYAEEDGIVILPQRGSCILDSPDEHLTKGKNLYEVLDDWETLLSYYPTFGDYYWVKFLMEESAMAGCGEEVVSVVKAGIKTTFKAEYSDIIHYNSFYINGDLKCIALKFEPKRDDLFYYASDNAVLEGDCEKSSGNDFSDMVSCDDNNGYVYVMSNESMPGLVKIGMTTNSPEKRLKELSSATGVPTEFKLIYYREFKNCRMAEKKIHSILESRGTRYNNKREFFKIDTVEAINCILSIGDY